VRLIRRLFGRPDEPSAQAPTRVSPLEAYVIREHALGRSIEDILADPYLKNRATEEQRLRLLESPEVIRAIGRDTAEAARERVRRG